MNVNVWFIFYGAMTLQCGVLLYATASQAGSSFSSSFSRAIGYILRGFVLSEMKVATVIECKRRCALSGNCLSLNILSNADGSFVCQLNSGTKKDGAKEQFVQNGAGEYYGLKEKQLCEDNGKTCGTASPWFAFNQSYFQFVTTKLNYEEARKYCLENKGDLASTSSEEEQIFLSKTFLEPNSIINAWVGLDDLVEEGVFVWLDGSPVNYIRWREGEPNGGNSANCAVMEKDFNGGFNDGSCSGDLNFFCEKSYESF